MTKIIIFLILPFIVVSCASTYYSIYFPLSEDYFNSSDNNLRAKIPNGWFISEEKNFNPNLLFYIINEDYTATIFIQELKLDRVTENRVLKGNFELLAELSMALKQESSEKFSIYKDIHTFKTNNKIYSGYEYYFDTSRRRFRTVVFHVGNRFYECTASPQEGVWFEKDLSLVFSAMHSFITSVQKFNPSTNP